MKKGKIILIFGISAVGKTYYRDILCEMLDLYKLRRCITRVRRDSEENSNDIYISRETFDNMKKNKEFFINTEINGEYYGYLNSDIEKLENKINLIGDCYYKLLEELKLMLKDNLVTICIQPSNLEYTKSLIKRDRIDYEKRIKDADAEYEYFEKNKEKIDFMVYTEYNKKTDELIMDFVKKVIINNKVEE